MQQEFKIEKNSVHLWRLSILDLISQEKKFISLLNPDELQRANRFRFPEHRLRFILVRGVLREILSLYTHVMANEIEFAYGEHGKPHLSSNPLNIHFNLSHSHDLAVYALTIENEIGIDIEKIEANFKPAVAKRFFSELEYTELAKLTGPEQTVAFYRIWAGKEALIKAVGEGLYASLQDFSIDLHKTIQTVAFSHEQETGLYHLENINVHPGYQSAFAILQTVNKKMYWEWSSHGPKVWDYDAIS